MYSLQYYKYKKTYISLLLLWATGPWGFGKQKLIAQETTVLTTAQQQWLDRTLKKQGAYKKQFKKILVHIDHSEVYIRSAAYHKICELLIDHAELANKKALKYAQNILQKIGIQESARETVQLLNTLVEANPKLALPIAKIIVNLTKVPRQSKLHKHKADVHYAKLALLTKAVVGASPECIPYLLKHIHQRTRVAGNNFVTASSNTTVPGLYVIEQLLRTDIVNNDSKYLDQALEIVLDGASLCDLVFERPPFGDTAVQLHAQRLLKAIVQQHPTTVKAKYDALTTQAREAISDMAPDMIALAYLTALTTADHQYASQLYMLFTAISESTDTRVQDLADKLHDYDKRASMSQNVSTGLTGFVIGNFIDTAFKSKQKKLAREQAKWQDDSTVITPLLRLLQETITLDSTHLADAFAMTNKFLKNDETSVLVQVEALNTLVAIITRSNTYTAQAIAIANEATPHKDANVRQATLRLLESILASDSQYSKDPTIVTNVQTLCLDKHIEVQSMATELREKYLNTTS